MKIFSQNPYWDDYNENKKFYEILFRPSIPVQARELTQLQTMLQKQIERFANHTFANGAKVIDGQMSFDTAIAFVKLQDTTADVTKLTGQTIVGLTSGVKAEIITATNAEGADPATLFVKYIASSESTNTQAFEIGEGLSGTDSLVVSNATDALGTGSIATIERGIYYINGYFALVDAQTIVLDKYSNVPSYRIGLELVESVVTPEQDSSLKDNANGSYNYNAPGAHRYSITLNLKKVKLGTITDENFIELGQIQSGRITKQTTTTEHSVLEKTLARRTYDESGDYTVRPFKILVREHRSNDRGEWRQATKYLRGDVVKSNGNTYTARTDGYSLSTGNGLTHTSGIRYENASTSTGIKWEYTPNPEFNNGVYNAEGKIVKLELVDGGTGYTTPPIVEVSGGGGVGAEVTAVIRDGTVVQLILENAGSGFISNDITVAIRGNGTGATARAYADFGEESKLAIGLESGKAYVQGFEIEKVGTSWVAVDKSRTYEQTTDSYVNAPLGNFVYVTNVHAMPPCKSYDVVDLYDQMTETKRGQKVGSKIGTARVRGIEWDSGNLHSTNGVYKLYLFDVNLNRGKNFSTDVKSFYFGGSSTQTSFTADVNPVTVQLSGSVTTYTNYPTKGASTTLTGTSTSFMTDVIVGSYLLIANTLVRVVEIKGQNSVVVDKSVTFDGAPIALVLTTINDPQAISAVYYLPNECIRSVTDSNSGNNLTYYTMEYLNGTASSESDGVCSVSFSISNGIFASEQENDNYILMSHVTGEIIKPIAISAGGTNSITFTLDPSFVGTRLDLMATVRKVGTGRKNKTTVTETKKVLTKDEAQSALISLGKADAFRLISVKMSNYAWEQDGNFTVDITDRYDLQTGQTSSYYGLSRIALKSSFNPPSNPIEITFEYFRHSNGDYFTVDSYPSDVAFGDIPNFDGVPLRDCIDFRPRISDTGLNFAETGSSYSATVKRGQEITTDYSYYLGRQDKIALDFQGNFVDVLGVPSLNPQLPETPSLSMNLYNLDIKPYTFKADSTNIVVETVDNRRYTMRDIGRLENRISNLEDYTTLSLLEQQTSNMEIQDADGLNRFKQGFVVDNFTDTTLANTQDPDYNCAIDPDNRELRPAFTQRSVSLVENEPSSRESANYKAYGKVFTLALDSENPHVVLVDQPFASKTENINPFAVATFYGTVSVNPSSDDWFETKYLPDVINQVEGDYLQKKNSLEGTKWNNWQVSWTGATRQTSNNTVQTHTTGRAGKNLTKYYQTTKTYAQEQGQTRTGIKTTVTSRIDYEEVGDRIVSTSEIPYMRSRYLAIKAYGLKPFTRFYPFFDNVGVDYWCTPCSRIEYIPTSGTFDDSSLAGADMSNSARIIETTKNAFWAEETDKTCLDVGDVITATSNTTGVPSHLSAVVVGKSYDGDTGKHYLYVTNIKVNGGKGVDGEYYSTDGVLQNNAKVKTFNANDVISGSISKALGRVVSAEPNHNHIHSPLVSNYAGELYFLFWIPDGDRVDYSNTQTENLTASFNFRCGERVLKVTDSIDNDSRQSESSGESSYSAVGVLNTRQKSINAVRNAVVTTQNVTENRTVTNTWSSTTNSSKYCDPLAETFMVDCKGGCFLSKVDIYFASKDSNLPVTLQIRTVENGYPSGKILAFGSVTKRPEDVNLSKTQVTFENDQGATVTEFSYDTPTTFEFESPVYVEDGTEYAIVLLSDSTKYRVWIAEVGDNVPNQSVVISKQPYNGVLFKSQNASTWTASQSQDLKFTLYRANFKTDAVANLQFQSAELKPQYLNVNPFQTVKDSGIVRVWHNFHGLYSGSLVSISYDDMKLIDAEPKMLTGQINYSNTTVSVTGSGTLFTKEIEHGDVLYTANDELVGVVNEIQSDTRLTLMEIPNVTATGVQLKRQVSVNGLPITALVGTHEISNVDMHSYVIEVPYKAKATGYAGNDSFKATYNINYDVIQPTITTQTFSDTAIAYTVDGVTGRSVDGSEIVNQSISGIPVVPNDNNVLLSPLAIMSPDNTTRTSLALNVNFSTTNSALSPVIDSDRVSAILINNSVDSPIETNVNVPSLDNMQLATGGISFVGGVKDVEVTLGSGYTTAQVEFSAPDISGGVRATGKAIIASGQITNIEITESGSGYTKAPTVTIVNADGVGAQTGQVTMSYNQIVTTNETTKKALDLATTGKYLTISNAKTSDNNGTFVIADSMDTDSSRVLVFEKSFTPETDNQAELYLRNLFVSEIAPSGGSVASKYITKVVSLNGSCSMVRTMMALSCPTEADVDVYMKTFTNGGTRGYENIPWAKLESDKAIVKTDVGIDSFNDVSFSYQPEDDFDMMALKIVFRSSNSSAVAKVKDLRMVACA